MSPAAGGGRDRRAIAIRMLAAERLASEVVRALEAAGIDTVVLKGPVIARRLYAPTELRESVDLDVLVRADAVSAGRRVLEKLGFRGLAQEHHRARAEFHGIELIRDEDRAVVDLHWTLGAAHAPPDVVWAALSERSAPLSLGGSEVRVPDDPTLAFHAALHAG